MIYRATIGLEVHAEVKTKSKMFCGCQNAPHGSQPNANTCPVCLAHPGTLPVVNEAAVTKVLQFGTAVGGSIATFSEFDRKNYFYPDIPKAYQISQYAYPFVSGGELAGVALTRVHLEEDTARSQHDQGVGSVVDFNRAGVPLMELVTEPVIHDADTAVTFAKELQLMLRVLGVSEANMEQGEMRVEANISVSMNDELGTKVEVKNLNSFRAVKEAIDYEITRQTRLLESGTSVRQETRGWDETTKKTFTQRSKETAKDYRYFPDPDIPKMRIDTYAPFVKSRLDESTPELPNKIREKYQNLGIKSTDIETILADDKLRLSFEQLLQIIPTGQSSIAALAVNYLLSDVTILLSGQNMTFLDIPHVQYLKLITMLADKKIGSRVAKDLLPEVLSTGADPEVLARERNLLQESDPEALRTVVIAIIQEHAVVVADYRAGKEAALKFLLGQVMKQTRGTADPVLAESILQAELST